MKRTVPVLSAAFAIALGTACVIHKDEVVAQPIANPDCWVKVYDADHFGDGSSTATLHGPIELSTLDNVEGKDWEDQIESLIVGPHAEIQVWKSANYAGTALTFQPGQKVEQLGDLNYGNEIGSLKVVCK